VEGEAEVPKGQRRKSESAERATTALKSEEQNY